MNKNNQIYVAPVIPIAKLYKPKFEIVDVYVKNEEGCWYLYLVNTDERTFRYRLDFYENE